VLIPFPGPLWLLGRVNLLCVSMLCVRVLCVSGRGVPATPVIATSTSRSLVSRRVMHSFSSARGEPAGAETEEKRLLMSEVAATRRHSLSPCASMASLRSVRLSSSGKSHDRPTCRHARGSCA
jgi:hypothetical protein